MTRPTAAMREYAARELERASRWLLVEVRKDPNDIEWNRGTRFSASHLRERAARLRKGKRR